MLQEKRFEIQVLKLCKSIQESSNEVLDFKTRQLGVVAHGSITNSIDGYLSMFMKLSFLELFFIQSMSMCFGFLFSQP